MLVLDGCVVDNYHNKSLSTNATNQKTKNTLYLAHKQSNTVRSDG
jgi:hypothetical protein